MFNKKEKIKVVSETCIVSKIRSPYIYRIYAMLENDKEWFEVHSSHRAEFYAMTSEFKTYHEALNYFDTLK